MSSLGQHWGGIVIAVGQDEYDAIDAADQVTPELITSKRQVSVDSGADQSSERPSAADRVFPGGWLLSCLAFGLPQPIFMHPRASYLPAERRPNARKAASWPDCQN